jgi:hypothetical protein
MPTDLKKMTHPNQECIDSCVGTSNRSAVQVPLTTRASIVIIKTALKTQNFEDVSW